MFKKLVAILAFWVSFTLANSVWAAHQLKIGDIELMNIPWLCTDLDPVVKALQVFKEDNQTEFLNKVEEFNADPNIMCDNVHYQGPAEIVAVYVVKKTTTWDVTVVEVNIGGENTIFFPTLMQREDRDAVE